MSWLYERRPVTKLVVRLLNLADRWFSWLPKFVWWITHEAQYVKWMWSTGPQKLKAPHLIGVVTIFNKLMLIPIPPSYMNLLHHKYHSQGVIALLKGRCIPQRYVVSEQINSKAGKKNFKFILLCGPMVGVRPPCPTTIWVRLNERWVQCDYEKRGGGYPLTANLIKIGGKLLSSFLFIQVLWIFLYSTLYICSIWKFKTFSKTINSKNSALI